MRVLIAAGGTLGHLNPSFVIADELKKRGFDIYYVTLLKNKSDKFIEYSDVLYVDIKSLDRKKMYKNVWNFCLNNKTKNKIKCFIDEIKPDIVISFGASVGALTIKSIKNKKIKSIIHEQNAVMGLGNKLVYKKVDKVLLTMDCNKKGDVIGNPVITDYFEKYEEKKVQNRNILVVCGTNGATYINDFFINNYMCFKEYNITIITGKKYYQENVKKINKINNYKFIIKDFETNMVAEYKKAEVVICRSGSGTLSEVLGLRKVTITIPSPNVSNNHQYYNAIYYYKLGCLEMIEENKMTIDIVREKINEVIQNKDKYINAIKNTQNVYSKYLFVDAIEKLLSEE